MVQQKVKVEAEGGRMPTMSEVQLRSLRDQRSEHEGNLINEGQ